MEKKLIEEKLDYLSKTMEGMDRAEINRKLKKIADCNKDELVVFEPQIDDENAYKKSRPRIMIVGRETNGWERENEKSVKKIAEEQTGSQFWQTIKYILALKEHNKDKNELCSSIVWSNLYKLASCGDSSIPSWLYNAQFDICKKLLQLEYENYAPDKVIFLSNGEEARCFIKEQNINEHKLNNKNPNEVSMTGEINVGEKKVPFIASKYHPGARRGVSPEELAKNIYNFF